MVTFHKTTLRYNFPLGYFGLNGAIEPDKLDRYWRRLNVTVDQTPIDSMTVSLPIASLTDLWASSAQITLAKYDVEASPQNHTSPDSNPGLFQAADSSQ